MAAHEQAWRRVTDFVHEHTAAKIGLQLGHSGRKGSTRAMWEGIDEPLPEGNWPLVAPSAIPYRAGMNQIPPCAQPRRDDGHQGPARAGRR